MERENRKIRETRQKPRAWQMRRPSETAVSASSLTCQLQSWLSPRRAAGDTALPAMTVPPISRARGEQNCGNSCQKRRCASARSRPASLKMLGPKAAFRKTLEQSSAAVLKRFSGVGWRAHHDSEDQTVQGPSIADLKRLTALVTSRAFRSRAFQSPCRRACHAATRKAIPGRRGAPRQAPRKIPGFSEARPEPYQDIRKESRKKSERCIQKNARSKSSSMGVRSLRM